MLSFRTTSDHLPRFITLTGDLGLKGFTWNLLERGYSKADNRNTHSNNPFNQSECGTEYLVRKVEQICAIGKYLQDNDFAFLQEADFSFQIMKGVWKFHG